MRVDLGDALFRPRGIAIVGASNNPDKLSGRPLDFLLRLGFKGEVYPINPTRSQVQGVASYSSLAAVTGPVDLAIVVQPSCAVPQALRECASAGVSVAIVFASGFAEMGGEGDALQAEVEDIVRSTGLRVIGPNCLGTFGLPNRALATFSSAFDENTNLLDDAVAIVSQSGAVGSFIYASLVALGIGARYYANTGNQADVTVGEVLLNLAQADDVEILVGYLEDGRGLDLLAEAAQIASSRNKPLLLLKSGATAPGSRAVGFHTASQPGSDEAFSALMAQHGAIRVESMEAVADMVLVLRPGRLAKGKRLAIMTSSGGVSALTTDAAVQAGLLVDETSAQTQALLRTMIPDFGSAANPIDLTGALLTDPSLIERTLAALVVDPEVDMVLVVLGNADRGSEDIVRGIHNGFKATDKPFAVAWSGGSGRPRQALLDLQVPTFSEPARAVKALERLSRFSLRTRTYP